MTDTHSQSRPLGVLAEFASPDALITAARMMREQGYTQLDAHTPYPMHELDEALAIRGSILPWLALAAGVAGGVIALALQWWTNAVDYAYIISGKPLFSWQANLPVTFEAVILSAALTVFFGTLALIGLPRLANPVFGSRLFARATSDRFLLWVGSEQERLDVDQVRVTLAEAGASDIETVERGFSPVTFPRMTYGLIALLLVAATIPPLLVARSRATTSRQPPLSSFSDMDYQPKYKSQTTSALFADRRAMRPPVPGTIARGHLQADQRFYRGLESETAQPPFTSVAVQLPPEVGDEAGAGTDGTGEGTDVPLPPVASSTVDEPNWTNEFPLQISDELMQRGRQRYNIFCATCHGRAGDGNGPVSVRALALEQGTWVPPTSLHAPYVREQPVGKLFNTITNGVRKMPGYGHQIKPEDRWAIVLYVRALQRSRNASPEDLPADEVSNLRELN